jgi:hypothetical protein
MLGLTLALGMYSKFSFPLFAGGLLLAALSLAPARARLADPRLLISVAIVAIALAPYAAWVLQVRGDPIAEVATTVAPSDQSHVMRSVLGLRRLASSIPLFLLPWLAFVALLVPQLFTGKREAVSGPALAERLALRTMLFAALLTALGIVVIGATNIAARYMHPLLVIAPVYVFAWIARFAPVEETARRIAVFALAVAIVLFGIRFVAATDNPLTRRADRGLLQPYAELAEALEARGIVDGTVVSARVREAGNLRAFLPDLRVVARDSFRVERPPRRPSDDRSCVLVWAEGQESEMRTLAPLDALAVERLDIKSAPSAVFAPAARVWFVARVDPKNPACR